VEHAHVERIDGAWLWPPTSGDLGVRVAHNGAIQVVWRCRICDYMSSAIPHSLLDGYGIDIRSLPTILSYAGRYGRCIVRGCESDEVELNHFAPQAIFGEEADAWPTGYLCVTHHREWGERVTPHLNHPRKSA
jgi:hypothetical protein